jgi:acyl-CoA synthetase (AMP-forming)/AMP-acid ligase II
MIRRPELPYEATVPALLRHALSEFPDHEVVVSDVGRLTYAEADAESRALAAELVAAGVGKGTRVGTQFPYGIEWVVSWLAITRIGALHMPFSTALKPAELRKVLRHGDVHLFLSPRQLFDGDHAVFVADALGSPPPGNDPTLRLPQLPFLRAVWFDGGSDVSWARGMSIRDASSTDSPGVGAELLDAIEAEVTPADLAVTIFTSGTTSEPKAVAHSHGALVRKGAHLAALLEWDDKDRVFCGMPFFWVGGVAMTVVPAFCVGATLLCVDRTEPLRSLDLMENEGATRMTGWPGVRGPILSHPTRQGRDIPALEEPPTGFGRQGSIGMTETLASYTYPDWDREVPDDAPGSMGVPIDGAEVRIADPETLEWVPDGTTGAILVRGYFLMQGIARHEREEVFTEDGFYNTGDKGSMRDGMLFLEGRLTEMIKTSGNNVAPPEVEAVLKSFPEVADAHVLGVPDAERGEVVAALVVSNPGAVDAEELRSRAREQLSNYKVPRWILVVDESAMPWLATGKPDRLAIRDLLAASRPS